MLELRCVPEITRSLPSCFVHVDGKEPKCSSGALRFQWTRTTLLARSDIGECTVPVIAAAVVQLLARWADVAVAFRLIGKALRTKERALVRATASLVGM